MNVSRAAKVAFATSIAAMMTWPSSGCQGGGSIGESCDSQSDCADELQCLDRVCVPRCERHTDCGDGHICRADGVCEAVESEIGAVCRREMDCAPGQACLLLDQDIDGDGWLTAQCGVEHPGGVLDATCVSDDECRMGSCVLGRCVQLCADSLDCPLSHVCSTIPRQLPSSAGTPLPWASFLGCLPRIGTLRYPIPIDETFQDFLLPVPSVAQSVAVVASVDDPQQFVGFTTIDAPDGARLYQLPLSGPASPEYFSNPVRHYPQTGISTVVMPQTLSAVASQPDLAPGAYTIGVSSFLEVPAALGTSVPHVEAFYKVDALDTLDIHFYFLDLEDHPCRGAFGSATLDADTAAVETGPFQLEYLDEIEVILAGAGISPGNATFTDIKDRDDLDGLDSKRLGDLLALSTLQGGINVFFVRTIAPSGLQALVGGPPGPPGLAGTRASGVVISAEALCYRSWAQLARTTAHELARALGLQRSVEPTGEVDAIAGTNTEPENLMYFGEGGGTEIHPQQAELLRTSGALR